MDDQKLFSEEVRDASVCLCTVLWMSVRNTYTVNILNRLNAKTDRNLKLNHRLLSENQYRKFM